MEPFMLYTVLIGILASEHREAATRKSESGTRTFFFKLLLHPKLGKEKKKRKTRKDKRKKLEVLKNTSVLKKSKSFKEMSTLPSILKAGKYS